MKRYKLLPLLLAGGILANALSGCAVTVATVAGVAAYSLSAPSSDSQHLTTLLHEKLPNSNLVTASLGENLILAGQINNESALTQAKTLIAKQDEQLTVYTYAKIMPIETTTEIQQDLELSQQVNALLDKSKLKSNGVVSNKVAYVLFDKNTITADINQTARNILTIPGVRSIVTVKP